MEEARGGGREEGLQCNGLPKTIVDGENALTLVEVTVDGANNIGEEVPEEWEEIDFLVDRECNRRRIGQGRESVGSRPE